MDTQAPESPTSETIVLDKNCHIDTIRHKQLYFFSN